MKVGVFTAPLSQLLLDEVPKKLKAFQIDTVELGTGNYPACPLPKKGSGKQISY